jgi:hypothetical protein
LHLITTLIRDASTIFCRGKQVKSNALLASPSSLTLIPAAKVIVFIAHSKINEAQKKLPYKIPRKFPLLLTLCKILKNQRS